MNGHFQQAWVFDFSAHIKVEGEELKASFENSCIHSINIFERTSHVLSPALTN